MPINIQNILLAIMKSKTLSSSLISKNTKFIATTSKNLKQVLSNNNFSSDLFYYLSMYNIFTLPLRDRKEDIRLLVREIISEFNVVNKKEKNYKRGYIPCIRKLHLAWQFNTIKKLFTKVL